VLTPRLFKMPHDHIYPEVNSRRIFYHFRF
jgi:hypothetical protein